MVLLVGNVKGVGDNFIELCLGEIWNVAQKASPRTPKGQSAVAGLYGQYGRIGRKFFLILVFYSPGACLNNIIG